jgi:hypothetical protein
MSSATKKKIDEKNKIKKLAPKKKGEVKGEAKGD